MVAGNHRLQAMHVWCGRAALLSEPAAADRRGIGFGWLQNAWLLHARLKILTGGLTPGSEEPTQKTRGPVH
jgi:hypothetical protein